MFVVIGSVFVSYAVAKPVNSESGSISVDAQVRPRVEGTQVLGADEAANPAVSQRARLGAELILLCRSEERGTALRDELVAAGTDAELALVDLLDGDAIDRFAAPWAGRCIDIVVHNAGALFDGLEHTDAGIERTAALHLLAPERLNRRLETALQRSESPRIIYVASGGMYAVPLLPDEIQHPATPFDGVRAYALCKRAQLECAKRWSSNHGKIRAFAMHPGWVDTPGVEHSLPAFYRRTKRWLRTPAQGADTVVWLASEANLGLPPGAFVFDRALAKEHILPGTRSAPDASQALVAWMDDVIPS